MISCSFFFKYFASLTAKFAKSKSTLDNLATCLNTVLTFPCSQGKFDSVCLNLSQSFDKVTPILRSINLIHLGSPLVILLGSKVI
jgi:hypothetical protein